MIRIVTTNYNRSRNMVRFIDHDILEEDEILIWVLDPDTASFIEKIIEDKKDRRGWYKVNILKLLSLLLMTRRHRVELDRAITEIQSDPKVEDSSDEDGESYDEFSEADSETNESDDELSDDYDSDDEVSSHIPWSIMVGMVAVASYLM